MGRPRGGGRQQGGGGGGGGGGKDGKKLDFAGRCLTDRDLDRLPLREVTYPYQEVDFSQNNLSAESLQKVLTLCLSCEKLRVLKLYKNGIDDEGARTLAGFLQGCYWLEELHLSHNCFTAAGVAAIVAAGEQRPSGVPPLWLRLEQNEVAGSDVVLQELQRHYSVCAREDGNRCTPRVCVHSRKVHLPHFHFQRSGPRRGGGDPAWGASVDAWEGAGADAWEEPRGGRGDWDGRDDRGGRDDRAGADPWDAVPKDGPTSLRRKRPWSDEEEEEDRGPGARVALSARRPASAAAAAAAQGAGGMFARAVVAALPGGGRRSGQPPEDEHEQPRKRARMAPAAAPGPRAPKAAARPERAPPRGLGGLAAAAVAAAAASAQSEPGAAPQRRPVPRQAAPIMVVDDEPPASRVALASRRDVAARAAPPPRRVQVTNIPADLTAQDLLEAFDAEVCDLDEQSDRAWLEFDTPGDAEKAVASFNNGSLNGRRISVRLMA